MGQFSRAIFFLTLGTIAVALSLLWVYPYTGDSSRNDGAHDAMGLLVMQEGSLGQVRGVVTISIDGKDENAYLEFSENDISGAPESPLTIYLGMSRQGHLTKQYDSPLECTVDLADGGSYTVSTVNSKEVWDRAAADGAASFSPDAVGEVTAIVLSDMPLTVKIRCPLGDQYRFVRSSLDSWNLTLPGVEVYAFDGAEYPAVSYSVSRDKGEFLQQASQAPSETLEDIFNWYEWDHNSLARQGLFLVISSSDLQRDSAYRLFIAGALVGLGGGFLVLGIQYVFEAIVPAQRNIDRH